MDKEIEIHKGRLKILFVHERTQSALQELIVECFQCNRNADRWVSVLGVDMVCPQASKLIHHQIAHYFPAVADIIGEKTLERYNISVLYGDTKAPKELNYSLLDLMQSFVDMCIDFQSMLMGTIKIAFEENDIHIYADLISILENYNNIVEQVILLRDKAEKYGSDIMGFDHDISDFWILGEE